MVEGRILRSNLFYAFIHLLMLVLFFRACQRFSDVGDGAVGRLYSPVRFLFVYTDLMNKWSNIVRNYIVNQWDFTVIKGMKELRLYKMEIIITIAVT